MFPLYMYDLDLYLHKLYMANKRVLTKVYDGEWQFCADMVWLNCLVDFFPWEFT